MFPIIIFGALAAMLAWAVRPKPTGITGPAFMGLDEAPQPMGRPKLGPVIDEVRPDLKPPYVRLLSLLVLFLRDKKFPAGGKKYLSPNTALEAVKLARALGLPKTAMAIRTDGFLPDDEHIPGRTEDIRQLVVKYGTTGKA